MIESRLIPKGKFNDAFDFENREDLLVASMEQSHSDVCLEIDKPGRYKADAIITSEKRILLVVKTADCLPVLVSDKEKIGVVHIGWKGLQNGLFHKTISNFNFSKLKISIGPFAQKCCYEVKEDLELILSRYCLNIENKIYLDLSKEIKDFCSENKIDLEVSDICTIENKKYNSYRRNKTKKRQSSSIWI